MGKALYIAEKPSVAQEFARALKINGQRRDGYLESDSSVVTWCVGHLVTMSYPDKYDPGLKKWSFETLPFLPAEFKYEVIPDVSAQFQIVKNLLNRPDVDVIYVCTDSGREGEYIYRLVAQMADVKGKIQKRVWIDSQTEEEILRGIREAKNLSEYDNLGAAAYLRAKEDYLMGINFSRALTLRYGNSVSGYLGTKRQAISVGRVMTCVLGMVVRREREIRSFVKTPFYRVVSTIRLAGETFEGEWRAVEGSEYFQSPKLYKENGFRKREDAEELIRKLWQHAVPGGPEGDLNARVTAGSTDPEKAAGAAKPGIIAGSPETAEAEGNLAAGGIPEGAGTGFPADDMGVGKLTSGAGTVSGADDPENTLADAGQGNTEGTPRPGEILPASAGGNLQCRVEKIERKKENRNPPMLFNLAELQNVCSKLFKISPDQTLAIAQELYEKKLVTYPRTDAHVLSTAVAKEIHKNISGLIRYDKAGAAAQEAYDSGTWKNIARTRYVNDKQITDHYAIIPTGQGLSALGGLSLTAQRVYETIVRRFLCIFYPAAVYQKVNLVTKIGEESFFSGFKVLVEEGYLRIADNSFSRRNRQKQEGEGKEDSPKDSSSKKDPGKDSERDGEAAEEIACDAVLLEALQKLRKNALLPVEALTIKEGETSPPKRYNSGSMILAMENAGQLIEDEDLRAQIKGAGIGTSATRAEILKKLFHIEYLSLNRKTQVITPTLLGEMVHDVVNCSIRQLLNPDLTASWEKGLNYVAEGSITEKEYMDKLEHFVRVRTNQVQQAQNVGQMRKMYDSAAVFYKKEIQKK